MLKRYSVAFVGATVVTVILILGMSEVAKLFERTDSQVYMRVMDFIPGSGARRLPDKRMPEAQPDRTQVGSGELAAEALGQADPGSAIDPDTEAIEVSIDLDQPASD